MNAALPAKRQEKASDFSVLIPARMASTRLPNKPLVDIGGLPMVVRVAQQALASQARRVVVATDASEVIAACRAHGVEALRTRTEHASGSDRLAECCTLLGLPENALVLNVQGDEPLIESALINGLAGHLAGRSDVSMATAAHPLSRVEDWSDQNIVKVVLRADQTALYFSRAPIAFWRDGWDTTQSDFVALPKPAPWRHIGIYAYRAGFLKHFAALTPSPIEAVEALEQLRALWHGLSIAVHTTQAAPASGVDTPQDLARVRALFANSSKLPHPK